MLVSLSMDTCMYVSMCVWLYACNITECNVCKFWYVIKCSGMLWYVVVCCGTPGPTVVSHPARVVTFNRRFLQLLSLGGMEKYIRQNLFEVVQNRENGPDFWVVSWRQGTPLVTHDLEKKTHRIARIVGWDEPLAPTREWSICALPTAYIYLTFPWLFFSKNKIFILSKYLKHVSRR